MGDEFLHQQHKMCIRLRPSLSRLLFEHLQVFSDNQVPHHPKLLGSRRKILASGDLVENGDKLEEGLWNYCQEQRNVDRHCITVPLSWLGLDVDLR